ncbi:MAG: Dolichyl-phosphate-mannose-protein mannosyltransferase [Elusimicrobia bacterium ADurb.Bin231]|nr:MAG: Dolichyl-phosphate-mannose-protein mannosyltransferase [Elusimicrobia bacterium ADurb.Bin231]
MSHINLFRFCGAAAAVIYLILLSSATGKGFLKLVKLSSPDISTHRNSAEEYILFQAIGFFLISLLIFLAGVFGGINKIVFLGLFGVLPALFLRKEWLETYSETKYFIGKIFAARKSVCRNTILTVASILSFALLLLNLINCTLPPTERDALKYHLKLPADYVKTGFVRPEPENFFSFFPQTTEMLYTFGLLFSNDNAAKLLHFYFGLLTAAVIFLMIKRFAGGTIALLCAIAFYSVPVASRISSWAYVDLALCFYTILALRYFSLFVDKKDTGALIIAGTMCGIALSIKYLALYTILILFIYLLFAEKETSLSFKKKYVIFLAAAIIPAIPWLTRNIILTGNPLYPFLYSLFGGAHWDVERANLYSVMLSDSYGLGKSPAAILSLPFNLVLKSKEGAPFDGGIGPVFTLFLPLILFSAGRDKKIKFLFLYSAAFFAMWAFSSQQARFLLPFMAAFSVCLGYGLDFCFNKLKTGKTILPILLLLCISFNSAYALKYFHKNETLKYYAGKISEEEYRAKHIKNYTSIAFINKNLRDDSKTYMVYIGAVGYYCKKPFFQESVFEEWSFLKTISEAGRPEDILLWFYGQQITHFLIGEQVAEIYLYPYIKKEALHNYAEFKKLYMTELFSHDGTILYKIQSAGQKNKDLIIKESLQVTS